MAIRCYLAMTASEFEAADSLPPLPAWMACHFSCYGLGLSNLPNNLPEGSMIIVNDRTPVYKHDPNLILEQLSELTEHFNPSSILLDFQRPGQALTAAIAKMLTEKLPCSVGVTEIYAKDLDCPVFLAAPPLHIPLKEYLQPFTNRQIWLEAALDAEQITVTPEGSHIESTIIDTLKEPIFEETSLYCNYHIDIMQDHATFTLLREKAQLAKLLEEAEQLCVTQAIGLYQQIGNNL